MEKLNGFLILHFLQKKSQREIIESKKESREILEDENAEEQSSHSVRGHLKNFLIYTLLLLFIPPFLNYTALIREDREFRQTGICFLLLYIK